MFKLDVTMSINHDNLGKYILFVAGERLLIAFVFEIHPKVAQIACLSKWHAFDVNLLGFVVLLVGSENISRRYVHR